MRVGKRRLALLAGALVAVLTATVLISVRPHLRTEAATAALPYQDPALPVADRVTDLLARMTVDDKVGQMTQAERARVSAGRHHRVPARLGALRRRLGAGAEHPGRHGPTCTTTSSAAPWTPRCGSR